MATSYAEYQVYNSTTPLTLSAGTYWLCITGNSLGATGAVKWSKSSARAYARAAAYSSATVDYTTSYAFMVFGVIGSPPQAEVPQGTGLSATIANTILAYDSVYTPRIVVSAEADCYVFYNATLKVTHPDSTTQTITIKLACAVDEEFEIDCELKTIKWVTATQEVVGRSCAYAVSFDDEEEWLNLPPGSNTFTYTESGMVPSGVVITIYDKDAYG